MRRGLAWVVGGVGGALALWMLSVGAGDGSTAPSSPPTEDRLEEVVERWRAHPSVEDAWLRLDGGEGVGAPPSEVALGSLRKWTTAAVVVSLVDDGVVALDAPIATWLSAWSDRPEVSLRRLLSHTSGLPMRPPRGTCEGLGTLAACVDALAAVPSTDAPGTRFRYSSMGFIVAAGAVEAATGTPYPQLFAERVAEPLGLTSARFDPAGTGLQDMAGTLHLSPGDVARFVRAAATGRGPQGAWLSPHGLELLGQGHTGGLPKAGPIPRGEWWTEGEDPYGLGVWRAGGLVDGRPRFLFSEGHQALVAGYDRAHDETFVVGFRYVPGTPVKDRVLPHEVIYDLCAARARDGSSAGACLPFAAGPEAQRTYRRCRAGGGTHRICLTAARRAQ